MIKKITFLSVLICCVTSCAQPGTKPNFTLEGKVKGLQEGWAYISYIREINPIDSIHVESGTFEYQTALSTTEYFNISFKSADKSAAYHSLMHAVAYPNTSITFEGDINKPSHWSISGHETLTKYSELRERVRNNEVEYLNLLKKYSPTSPSISDEDKLKLIQLTLVRNSLAYQFIDANPESDAALLAVLYSLSSTIAQADPNNIKQLAHRFNKVVNEKNRSSILARSLEQTFASVGISTITKAINFTQNDVNGNPTSLSDYKGKYVLLDFWASWCGPCRKENPNVVSAYNRFKGKGFDIVGISLDRNKAAWMKAIKQDQLSWTHLSDLQGWNNSAAKLYKVQGIPANFLLDPEGKVIASNLRGEDLHKVLESIFK